MADTSVSAGAAREDGSVPYELGKPNWQGREIPDIDDPSRSSRILEGRMCDVLILGDGFQSRAEFEQQLASWISSFYALTVYDVFRGAFRVRALYRHSAERASPSRGSYYRVSIEEGKVADGEWWEGSSDDDVTFRQRVFEDVDSFPDVNLRRYPSGLSFGGQNTYMGDWLFGLYRNLVVALLVHTDSDPTPSGRHFRIAREPDPDPDRGADPTRLVVAAGGSSALHEFSHAFGLLTDEYIKDRGKRSNRVNPTRPSVFTLTNVSYSDRYAEVPWLHLSPWGRDARQSGGDEPSPVVGWLWVGGSSQLGVWHSEYRCLMNGGGDNFAFTQDEGSDPTAGPDGVYEEDDDGAWLREHRFCLWCQEVVTLRVLERTGQLDSAADPTDFLGKGEYWYSRWTSELRDHYWRLFDVSRQIRDSEARYAAMHPGASGERLDASDLYTAFRADDPGPATEPPDDDENWALLLG
ncbi:MAG: M64 family metallopeptidase [Candidatus Nanopelagicales bacterium]|jgi:hypothetical protein|nr:M64 family metallopeptidase [Candidatus Nanopelagicales bacterium]